MVSTYQTGGTVYDPALEEEEIPVEEPAATDVQAMEQASWDAAMASQRAESAQPPATEPAAQSAPADEVPVEEQSAADPNQPAPADQSTIDYSLEVGRDAYERSLAAEPAQLPPVESYAPVIDEQGQQVADPRMAESDQATWDAVMAQPEQSVQGRAAMEAEGERILQAREEAQYGLDAQGNPLPRVQDEGDDSWIGRLTPFDEIGDAIAGGDGFSAGDLNPLNVAKGVVMGTLGGMSQVQYRQVEWIGEDAYRAQADKTRSFGELSTAEKLGLLPAAASLGLSNIVGSAVNSGEPYAAWANDPENKQLVIDLYEKGYNGYTGGRALWEYYQNETGKSGLQKVVNDIGSDPLTLATLGAGGLAKQGAALGGRVTSGLGRLGVPAPVAQGIGKATQAGLEKLPYLADPTETVVPAARLAGRIPGVQQAVDATVAKPIRYLAGQTADAAQKIDADADLQVFAELAAQARRQGGVAGDAGAALDPVVTMPPPGAAPGTLPTVEIRMPDGSVTPFDPAIVLDNLARLDLARYQPEFAKWFEFMKQGNPYGLPHTLDTLLPSTRTGGTAAYNNYIDLMAKRALRYGEDVYEGMYRQADRFRARGQWGAVGHQLDAIQNVQTRSGVPYTARGDGTALAARQALDTRLRNEAVARTRPIPGRRRAPLVYNGPARWTPNTTPLAPPRGPFDSGGLLFSPDDVSRLSRDVDGQKAYEIVDQARRDLEEARALAQLTARNAAQQQRLDDIFGRYGIAEMGIRGLDDAARMADLDDLTIDSLAAMHGRRQVEIATGIRTRTGSLVEPAYYEALNKVIPKFGNVLRTYDRVSQGPRTLLLYNYLNAPGFFGRQVIGNATGIGLTADRGTLTNFFKLTNWAQTARRSAGGPKAVETAVDQIRRESGLGASSKLRRGGPLPEQSTAADTGLTRWLAPRQLRTLVEVPDLQVREAAWRTRFDPLHARLRQDIRLHAVDRAPTFGVSVTRGQIDAALDALEADAIARTGRPFYSPERLRDALQGSGATAPTPEALRDWSDRVARDFLGGRADDAATGFDGLRAIDQNAVREAERVGFGGPETRADAILSRIFFYHHWSSRAGLTYARELLRNPIYGQAYYDAVQGLNREAEENDYPPFLKATIRFMGTQAGFNAYVRGPESIFGTMLTATEDMFRDPNSPEYQRMTALGTAMERAPFMVNPWLAAAMYVPGLMGADAQAPSPLGTSGMWGRIIDGYNLVRAARNEPLVPRSWRPEPAVLNYLANLVSGWAEQAGLPVEQVSRVNWGAQDATNRRWFVQQVLAGAHPEWSEEEILAEASEIQDDLDNPVTQAAIDLQAQMPFSGPRFTGALDGAPEQVRNTLGGLYQAFGPLPATVRPANKDANQAARGEIARLKREEGLSQKQAIDRLGLTDAEAALLYEANETVTTADQDVLTFRRTMDAYTEYGTPQQRGLDGTYQAITKGEIGVPIEANGRTWTPQEIAALPEDRRRQLAKVWLADSGNLEEWQAYKDGKQAFREANPELTGYWDFVEVAEGYGGGVDAWAERTRSGNRSFDLYVREQEQVDPDTRPLTPQERRSLDPEEVLRRDGERAKMLTSADAYLAANGVARTVYDVNDPRPSGDYGPFIAGVPAGLTPTEALRQGGAAEPPSDYEQYRAEQTEYLQNDIANFAGMVQIMNDWDASVGNPVGATRDAYIARLLTGNKKIGLPDPVYDQIKATYDYVWPSKGNLKDYLDWYLDPQANPQGSDSIEDFLDWDSLNNARGDLEKPLPPDGEGASLAELTGNRQKVYADDGTWSLGLRPEQAPAAQRPTVTVRAATPLLVDWSNPLATAGMAAPGLPLVDLGQPVVGRDRNYRLVQGPDGSRFWVDAALLVAA